MVANVLTVVSSVGDEVTTGETMLILESMKMEIPVIVEESGVVLEIRVHEGDVVQEGDVLVVLSSPDGARRP
jgi:acetyl-CoA carboxylase biotin carboxyl carrier protein